MVVMLELLTNGFTITILPTKHALLIKLLVMIMELNAQLLLNVKIVFLEEDVGLNKKLKFTVLTNMEMLRDNRI